MNSLAGMHVYCKFNKNDIPRIAHTQRETARLNL